MSTAIKPNLVADPTVKIGTALFLAVISPFIFAFLYAEMFETYSRLYFDLPLVVVVIVSMQYRLQRIEDRFERRFWNLWTMGLVVWFTQVVLVLVTQSESGRSLEVEIASQALFYLFYVALALGLESQPHISAEHVSARLRLFDWLGVSIFFLGLLLYFVIVPRIFEPDSYQKSSWLFYVVGDIYLSIRLAGFVRNAGERRWRRIYAGLLTAALLWLVSDSLGLAVAIGIFARDQTLVMFDPFLLSSFLAVLIASRSREFFQKPADLLADAKRSTAPRPASQLGLLVFYAMMFPLMHFVIANTGLFVPSLVPIRESLVLIFLVFLSILAYVYQRILEAENRRLEDTRVETTKALLQSEAKFRRAFESVTVGSVVIDNRGKIESFNPMAQKIFGYTPEEVIGQNVRMLMPESVAAEHDSFLQRYEETKESVIIGAAREVKGLRKNGEEFPMHLGIGERVDEGGNSYIGSITDLTEIKSIERQLMRTQKMDAVGQLSGGIAHDFNNILNIILGNVELLESQLQAKDKADEFLGAIRKSAQRAAELTQKLLVFSGRQPTTVTITDVNQVVADMESLIARSLTPEVQIEHQFAEDLWRTEINPGDLEDALVNLVLNARDAMPGGGMLTLATYNRVFDDDYCAQNPSAKPGEYVELSVSDTGEGMTPEQQQHIFEPFFTTKESHTGLGLAMVYGFAKRFGGYMDVHSETGIGTTFRFYLPRADSPKQRQRTVDADTESLPRGTHTLLVVDDEEAIVELARIQLESLGYRVLVAGDAQQALTLLTEEPEIELMITDIVMPGMNGFELSQQATASRPALKVLLTSGYEQDAMTQMSQTHLIANLLSKPYTKAELAKRVGALINDASSVDT